MKMLNKTQYDTNALRSLLTEVHNLVSKTEGRLKTWGGLRVKVVTGRNGRISGYAYLTGHFMRLRIPKPETHPKPHDIAYLMEHELMHCYGYKHSQMGVCRRGWATAAERYKWADEMFPQGIPVKTPKVRVTPDKADIQEKRYLRVVAQVKTWTTKLKRAQTAIKKLAVRRRYYEKVLAAAGRMPKE